MLGVDMGGDLLPANRNNPRGFFEERPFISIHEKIIGDWMNPNPKFDVCKFEYFDLVRKYSAKSLWGVKDPRMCCVFPHFMDMARGRCNIKVVNVYRPLLESAKSLVRRHFGMMSLEEAVAVCEKYDSMKEESLLVAKDVFEVGYYDLISDTERVVRGLAQYVGLGDANVHKAVDLVDPKLSTQS
jgi:hypothetical protein